ncbi:spermidine/putrescine transport system permease protein [Arboricoccus pini]|uniref:Spermidine/putrescine transport system permease protein n=1 Tax=Arboricoccus pini TaxID=1963835 RepID=A0A212RJG7_9PROT|nr:ABC transporter permease [Arboricoccus pini]SNB72470.1 spermidine/putrescine transport system permease protein [Arboricoccus pini]
MTPRRALLLLLPSILMIGIFMAVPMIVGLVYSFMTADSTGGVEMPFTFDAYISLLYERDFDDTLLFTSDYLIIILRSVGVAAIVTLLCLVMALPLAWYITCQPERRRPGLLFIVSLPFWINMLIRTYCWVLILRDQGLINILLMKLGLISSPLPLLYNNGAVFLGLVYTFLPFMVLPIYATLERQDPKLIEAAFDLYATRWAVARRVVWPLAKPGVIAGTLLVFAPALGSYLAPDLLGGGKQLYIGNLIQMQFSTSRNWPFGAALATLITVVILGAMIWQQKRVRRVGLPL